MFIYMINMKKLMIFHFIFILFISNLNSNIIRYNKIEI